MNNFIDFRAENRQSFIVDASVLVAIWLSSLSVTRIFAIKNISKYEIILVL